jgi:hypothetical protein
MDVGQAYKAMAGKESRKRRARPLAVNAYHRRLSANPTQRISVKQAFTIPPIRNQFAPTSNAVVDNRYFVGFNFGRPANQ